MVHVPLPKVNFDGVDIRNFSVKFCLALVISHVEMHVDKYATHAYTCVWCNVYACVAYLSTCIST